ncbi:MAG: hypothetical protein ABWZ74_06235, partial [Hyphomicrobiaceae bacterium]
MQQRPLVRIVESAALARMPLAMAASAASVFAPPLPQIVDAPVAPNDFARSVAMRPLAGSSCQ